VRTVTWADDDPLADTFLVQQGAYPETSEIGIDYADILSRVTMAINIGIDKTAPIPATIYDHVSPRLPDSAPPLGQAGVGLPRLFRRGCDGP
jgi:hypothetical protein